jgi:tRNA A37 methylthiotransferase MiaB
MQNERWRGWEGEILINEKGTELGQWIGRNDSFKPVIVEGDYKLGQRLKVKIEKTTIFDLRGIVVGEVV